MADKPTFELTENHVRLARRLNIWVGGKDWTLNSKRPYGNSDIIRDVHEIATDGRLGELDEDRELPRDEYDRCQKLHESMGTALQVILSTKSFALGKYEAKDRYGFEWFPAMPF